MSERDYDDCNDEWRNLPYCLERVKNTDDPTEFWCSIRKLKQADGTLMFPKLSEFMLNLLVLPHSSAAVERIFSQVKLIKNDTRNRLNTDSLNGLLLTKENGGKTPCFNWEPSISMIHSAQTVFKQTMST